MDEKIIEPEGELIFTGEKLRQYLRRKGISYKMAAEQLGINKNTVAKVVRGGNVNVEVILKICNTYRLDVGDLICRRDEVVQSDALIAAEWHKAEADALEMLRQNRPICSALIKSLQRLLKE